MSNVLPVIKKTRTMRGTVLRKSGDKTVAVQVSRVEMHPMYQKRRTVTKTYLAHDEGHKAVVGMQVTIKQSRPLSARKRWVISSYQSTDAAAAPVKETVVSKDTK